MIDVCPFGIPAGDVWWPAPPFRPPPTAAPSAPTGAYRPPGSRGAAATFALKDTTAPVAAGKVKVNKPAAKPAYQPPVARVRVIPGMAPSAAPVGAPANATKQKKDNAGAAAIPKNVKPPAAPAAAPVPLTLEEKKK